MLENKFVKKFSGLYEEKKNNKELPNNVKETLNMWKKYIKPLRLLNIVKEASHFKVNANKLSVVLLRLKMF
jgi:hypothetical protein